MNQAILKTAVLNIGASFIGLPRLIRYTGENLINVFYHTVSDEYLPHIHPSYTPKKIAEFERDLDFLLQYFQAVDIYTVKNKVSDKNYLEKPSFHLSFDDGLREVYHIIMPILERKGIPATVFVNPAFVDNRVLFCRHKQNITTDETQFLQTQSPYLTWDELKTMRQHGFTIGAHSIDHPNYAELSEEEQIRQTLQSCREIEAHLGEPCRFFAFPFSEAGVKDSFFRAIASEVDLTFGISGITYTGNGRHLGRIDMERYGKNARQCIHRAYTTCFLKQKRIFAR
jgi:peptidoglycan/xylan/chitin deacetylase (PgdA/CDA1 family)